MGLPAGKMNWSLPLCVILSVTLLGYVSNVESASVMSVDLGSEWMKVGVVSPGVPMEIALNKESKRKTPAVLSFKDGVRTFGEDAQTLGTRFPANAYAYLMDLLGKTIDSPVVDLYRKRFPYYEIIGDEDRNTVVFKNGEETFSVEELIAQILVKAREFAEDSTRQPISECVLIVPGYFGQAERTALLAAAQLANLKVLQLINDYTAVALNYGVFNRADINETAQYYIFYDMGAQKTSAALVSYQIVKDKQTKDINPVVQVLGVGYDRNLGGLEIQLRLRDYLASEFNKMKKTKTDVTKNARSMAKLFKEAGRVKNVLSANMDHFAQIEGLLEEHDFKVKVTREKLEELCNDLWPRVVLPLQQALKAAGLSLDVVNQVILFGGSTRVPKVQEILRKEIKSELGKSLNSDEAATMGAVYKGADLTTGFKVKKFVVKDAVIFPIQVSFERDPGDGASSKHVKRVLFGQMNSYPQKKVITFNKHTSDFDFFVHYGDLGHLSKAEISYIGGLNLSHVQLTGINEVLEKSKQNEIVEHKGIKAYFFLDESGVLNCVGVENVYEKPKTEDDEGTLAKLGSTISKLFSGKDKTDKDSEDKKNEQAEAEEKATEEAKTVGDGGKNGTKSDDLNKENAQVKNETVKFVTVKDPVDHTINVQFTKVLSEKSFDNSFKKLAEINKAEETRTKRETIFNALESHAIEAQHKLGQDEYSSCATEAEIETILKSCSEISDWLYEDGDGADIKEYEKRLSDLQKLTNVIFARHWEHEERPEALKALAGMVDASQKFLVNAQNLTKENNPEKDIFTEVEVKTLEKAIQDTIDWKNSELADQEKLAKNVDVKLTVKDITDKMAVLDREVKYLVNKLKIWKPKPPKVEKTEKKENKTEKAEKSEETVEADPEKEEEAETVSGDIEGEENNSNNDEESHNEL